MIGGSADAQTPLSIQTARYKDGELIKSARYGRVGCDCDIVRAWVLRGVWGRGWSQRYMKFIKDKH